MSAIDQIAQALVDTVNPEQQAIAEIGVEILDLLLLKNLRYGSSATNPIRVFSKLSPEEGILIRCDDKLSRIRAGAADDDEDPLFDLVGYLVLLLVERRKAQR
jgi:hypothetical protein